MSFKRRIACFAGIHHDHAGRGGGLAALLGHCPSCHPTPKLNGCGHSGLADCVRLGCQPAKPFELAAPDDTPDYLLNRKAFWLFPDRWADDSSDMQFDDGSWQPPSAKQPRSAQIKQLDVPPQRNAKLGCVCRHCFRTFSHDDGHLAAVMIRFDGHEELRCLECIPKAFNLRLLSPEEEAYVFGEVADRNLPALKHPRPRKKPQHDVPETYEQWLDRELFVASKVVSREALAVDKASSTFRRIGCYPRWGDHALTCTGTGNGFDYGVRCTRCHRQTTVRLD